MTTQDYIKISKMLREFEEKVLKNIDKHTKETISIIKGKKVEVKCECKKNE